MALPDHGAERTGTGISLNSKEMLQAYEIRAALEEVGGRAAASALKGNTAAVRRELEAMRAAFDRLDLESFVEHDIAFHRNILQASQNEVLLRVWESLAVDLRIRGVIGMVSRDFPELVESHRRIVDALEKGLEKLRIALGIRRELARSEGIAAYMVFADRSLIDMARLKPQSADDLKLCYGVGETKLARYGKAFIAAVAEFG